LLLLTKVSQLAAGDLRCGTVLFVVDHLGVAETPRDRDKVEFNHATTAPTDYWIWMNE
jgi:hypothetical protein